MALLSRFLTLVAVLLMPVGMIGSPAAAAAPAAMADSGHCGEHEGQKDSPPAMAKMHCAACSALPAAEAGSKTAALLPTVPPGIGPVPAFDGIVPDITTPPPKTA